MIPVHFFGHREGDRTIASAQSLGVGQQLESRNAAEAGKFQRLYREAPLHWRATSLDEAVLAVMAVNYCGGSEGMPEVLRAEQLGKPVLLFHEQDDVRPLPASYGTLYRVSFESHRRLPHEQTMPALSKDYFADGLTFAARELQELPVVGFCGFVGTTWSRLAYRVQMRKQKVLGLDLRHKSLKTLERAAGITTNFIYRSQFWGGTVSRKGVGDPQHQLQVRNEYLENIVGSDYTLCLRGAGNFSYRFYETLSLGRIPLFINTNCVLPFADEIDWRRHCVWIEPHEIPQMGRLLLDFHRRLTPDEFTDLQRRNRQLWEDYLRPLEFYQHAIRRTLQG